MSFSGKGVSFKSSSIERAKERKMQECFLLLGFFLLVDLSDSSFRCQFMDLPIRKLMEKTLSYHSFVFQRIRTKSEMSANVS